MADSSTIGPPSKLDRTADGIWPHRGWKLGPWRSTLTSLAVNVYTAWMAAFPRGRVRLCPVLALLPLGALVWGCSPSGSWRLFGVNLGTPHEVQPAAKQVTKASPDVGMGFRAEPALPLSLSPERNQTRSSRSVQVVRLGFEVLRIDLPSGGVGHSRKIWNHVDELRVDSELVARAARNGMRFGAASAGAWPAIRTILGAAEATVRREQIVPQGDSPIIIELAKVGDHESIFHHGKDNRLVGKTFSGGVKVVTLDYAYHPELGGGTNLRLSLEVRPGKGNMGWEPSDTSLGRASSGEGHLFEDLIVMLTLNPGEFLVIGPSQQATNEFLIGRRFFTCQRAGEGYETLLCVTPKPYKTDTR